jgi:hypothetical protein
VDVKTENAHVKEDEVKKCNKTGSAESFSTKDKKPIIKREEVDTENQDIEGNHIKKGDKLDENIKETSSEKPVHSFFGNCNNYKLSKGVQFKCTESYSSRNNQHNAHICTTVLFYMLAPTCFGSSLQSSVVLPSSAGKHNRLNHNTPTHRPLNYII